MVTSVIRSRYNLLNFTFVRNQKLQCVAHWTSSFSTEFYFNLFDAIFSFISNVRSFLKLQHSLLVNLFEKSIQLIFCRVFILILDCLTNLREVSEFYQLLLNSKLVPNDRAIKIQLSRLLTINGLFYFKNKAILLKQPSSLQLQSINNRSNMFLKPQK